jgi:hypothetical protein
MEQEPFLRRYQSFSYCRISQHFVELESSLPCSKELSYSTYPEPNYSIMSPQHISLRSVLILSSHLSLAFIVISFVVAFPPKPYMHFFSTRPAHLILLVLMTLILFGEEYKL